MRTMTINTVNTRYTFVTENGLTGTLRSTNPKYAGPFEGSMIFGPQVGRGMCFVVSVAPEHRAVLIGRMITTSMVEDVVETVVE